MAIGFPASYTTTVGVMGASDEVRTDVLGALQSLGWKYEILGPDRCLAQVSMNILSWGETLMVDLAPGGMRVTSTCKGIQVIDWGKNRQNVEQFLTSFSAQQARRANSNLHASPFQNADGASPVENLFRDDD